MILGVEPRQFIGFVAMVLGMFMAVLDIQIVSSSLSVIGAGLSATQDELSWIQTSYLIAEIIIIPLSGFTAKVLSTRISFFYASLVFTIMSLACACATSIEAMIIFRLLQGFFGGAMIPTTFATSFMLFPSKYRAQVNVMTGLVVTIAPTLGPTIGGYITEVASWHYMFIVNVIPGIVVCTLVWNYADFDKPNHGLLKNFDLIGIILLAISLGTCQYVLEEGAKKNWWEDDFITLCACISAVAGGLMVYRELTFSHPVLDFSAFRNRNFLLGCSYGVVLGVGLFGSVYIMPLFLFSAAHLDTLQIGKVMFVTGAAQFIGAPIAGKVYSSGIDRRIMLLIGLSGYAYGSYLNAFLTPDSRFGEFFWPQVFRGLSLMFCFMPINDLALGSVPKSQLQGASGLYNLTRNLGGAFGLAIINTSISNNMVIYSDHLLSNVTKTGILAQNFVEMFVFKISHKVVNADAGVMNIIHGLAKEASFVLAINNIFFTIAILFALGILFLPLLQNTAQQIEGGH